MYGGTCYSVESDSDESLKDRIISSNKEAIGDRTIYEKEEKERETNRKES